MLCPARMLGSMLPICLSTPGAAFCAADSHEVAVCIRPLQMLEFSRP